MSDQELYQKFQKLKTDFSAIGLSHEENRQFFCTPIGAEIIGWDNAIHYCFIPRFGPMVFAVNPESCCDDYVYPLAKCFYDFLRLILAAKGTNPLQQIILWDETQYYHFVHSPEELAYAESEEVVAALTILKAEFNLAPMDDPFTYVKTLQKDFPYHEIPFEEESDCFPETEHEPFSF